MNRTFAYAAVTPIKLEQVEVRIVAAVDRTNVRLFDRRNGQCLRSWLAQQFDAAVQAGQLDPTDLLVSAYFTYVAENTDPAGRYSGARA
jgi:hypothetical protein